MASLGHNELKTSSGISNAEYLVWLEYGLSIQDLHAKHIATLAYRNSILPQKCPDDKHDISLQVLTYEYCAYYDYEPSVPWRYEHSRYDNLSDDKSYRNTNGL